MMVQADGSWWGCHWDEFQRLQNFEPAHEWNFFPFDPIVYKSGRWGLMICVTGGGTESGKIVPHKYDVHCNSNMYGEGLVWGSSWETGLRPWEKKKPHPQLLKCFCLGCWEIWGNFISQKKELQSIMKPTVHLSFPVTNTPKHFVDSLFCYFTLKYLLYSWWVFADQRSVPATFICRNGCWVWPTCSISKDSQPSCMDPFDSTLLRMMII